MENMRVNHLPSLTWNALHMNDSRVDSAVTAGEAYIEKNLSMGLEEGIRGEELPCFEKIKTGMGRIWTPCEKRAAWSRCR